MPAVKALEDRIVARMSSIGARVVVHKLLRLRPAGGGGQKIWLLACNRIGRCLQSAQGTSCRGESCPC